MGDAATTEIGVLGGVRGAAVDRTGVVAPHAAGWMLDWWIGADDRWHVPAREAAVRQQLVDGMPVVQTSMRVPGGDAVQRAYGVPVPDDGEVALVEIANESPAPFVAALVVRGASSVDLGETTVYADGRSALRTARPPSRWAMGTGGNAEEIVASGGASDAPFAPRRDRGALAGGRLPLPGRAPHVVACRGRPRHARGLGAVEVQGLPAADAVARGWQAQLDRGLRVELPDPVVQAAVDAARPAAVLGGQAWKVDPAVVAVLEDWGLDTEAAVGWSRLTGRERRRIARRDPPTGSWARVRDLTARGDAAALLGSVREVLVTDGDDTLALLGDWPREWDGLPVDVRDAPTRRGPMSYSVRWHGDRPALLWDAPAGTRVTVPGLDPSWSSTEPHGEVLLARPAR